MVEYGILIGGPGDGGEFTATMTVGGHDFPAKWKSCEGRWYERTEEHDAEGRVIFKLISHIGAEPPAIGDDIPCSREVVEQLVEMHKRGER